MSITQSLDLQQKQPVVDSAYYAISWSNMYKEGATTTQKVAAVFKRCIENVAKLMYNLAAFLSEGLYKMFHVESQPLPTPIASESRKETPPLHTEPFIIAQETKSDTLNQSAAQTEEPSAGEGEFNFDDYLDTPVEDKRNDSSKWPKIVACTTAALATIAAVAMAADYNWPGKFPSFVGSARENIIDLSQQAKAWAWGVNNGTNPEIKVNNGTNPEIKVNNGTNPEIKA